MPEAWSDHEIRVALDSYFTMMWLETRGVAIVKAEHRHNAMALLSGRSEKSVDFKWCNISAVLDDHGFPWLRGFKPLRNYQERLKELTILWLGQHPYTRATLMADGKELRS